MYVYMCVCVCVCVFMDKNILLITRVILTFCRSLLFISSPIFFIVYNPKMLNLLSTPSYIYVTSTPSFITSRQRAHITSMSNFLGLCCG